MKARAPLQGIRVHLSGSIPDGCAPEQHAQISMFVEKFARTVLSMGGTLLHGSHPSLLAPLREAALPFVASGGSREALILVRSQHYATDPAQVAEIEAQREYCTVQLIPSSASKPDQALVPSASGWPNAVTPSWQLEADTGRSINRAREFPLN